jgi:hypothetical protein
MDFFFKVSTKKQKVFFVLFFASPTISKQALLLYVIGVNSF